MKVKCPICGTVNIPHDLKQTDGWMKCEKCGSETQQFSFEKKCLISVFDMDNLPAIMSYLNRNKKKGSSSTK
jgi:uncharacterized Zn finger protein